MGVKPNDPVPLISFFVSVRRDSWSSGHVGIPVWPNIRMRTNRKSKKSDQRPNIMKSKTKTITLRLMANVYISQKVSQNFEISCPKVKFSVPVKSTSCPDLDFLSRLKLSDQAFRDRYPDANPVRNLITKIIC